MRKERWEIRDSFGKVLQTGATEGQAWIEFFELTGSYFNGEKFLKGVAGMKRWFGYYAVEVA